jgi:hypothetical protein
VSAITPLDAGGYDFLADPTKSATHEPIFWNPDDYAKVVILQPAPSAASSRTFKLANLPADSLCRDAEDGVHIILGVATMAIQLWIMNAGDNYAPLAAVLPLDGSVGDRAEATLRFWRLLAHGGASGDDSGRNNNKLISALRALDAKLDGASYRMIAEAIFGADQINIEAWKTSSRRDAIIRLVRKGIAMMHGKYLSLLHRRD